MNLQILYKAVTLNNCNCFSQSVSGGFTDAPTFREGGLVQPHCARRGFHGQCWLPVDVLVYFKPEVLQLKENWLLARFADYFKSVACSVCSFCTQSPVVRANMLLAVVQLEWVGFANTQTKEQGQTVGNMFSPNETGFCPHCKGWKVKPEPHKNSSPHTENMRRAEADIIRSLCVMDALCSVSSYCSGLALVSGGNYCSLNRSPFSFFYRTPSNVHGLLRFSLDSWWLQTEITGSVSSRADVCSGQHLKQREYVCSVGFFLFTDASAALIWPQLQWAPPWIPAAVTSHLIKTRLAHMFLWQVSSSLCTGEMHWICTPYGRSHPAEKAAILGSGNMWLHIWWWMLQSLACWSWQDFICTKMLFNAKRFDCDRFGFIFLHFPSYWFLFPSLAESWWNLAQMQRRALSPNPV